MRSIHVPPDQLEVFHGESNEDEILLRMARKYRRLLYHNRILFFDKCSIDPEVRTIVHKYRAENGVHAYGPAYVGTLISASVVPGLLGHAMYYHSEARHSIIIML
jgi:hypothetical protein